MGSDLAAVLAEYLEYHLVLLGLNAFAATSGGKIVHLTRNVTAKDIVVRDFIPPRIAPHRGRCAVCAAPRRALYRRHRYASSPLARVSDETFLAGIGSNSFGASYAAPVALLNALIGALVNTAAPSLCESPGKSPKNNSVDRAGITSETPEVVLYFLQQMFHTFGLSRRLIVWRASFDAGRHVRIPPSFTLFCVSCCSKGGRNARRGNHLAQAADAPQSAIRNELWRN